MLRLTIAFCLIVAAPAAAKPGTLDRTFASNGRAAFGEPFASDVATDGSGKLLLAGTSVGERPLYRPLVTVGRLDGAGRPDGGFGTAGWAAFDADPSQRYRLIGGVTIAPLPAGGAVVAGMRFEEHSGDLQIAVWRLRPDGSVDPGFGDGGVTLIGGVRFDVAGIGLDASGRIVVAGTNWSGPFLTRLRPDGSFDTGYGTVQVAPGYASSLLVLGDGTAYVALRGGRIVSIYRVDASGTRKEHLSSLALNATAPDYGGRTVLARGPRGTVLVAVNDVIPGRAEPELFGRVARLRRDGKVDRTFGSRGRATIRLPRRGAQIDDMACDARGRIVLVGAAGTLPRARTLAVRLTPSGRHDRRFGDGGTVLIQRLGVLPRVRMVASYASAVAIDRRGRIVLAGTVYDDHIVDREDLGRGYLAVARLKG